MKATGACQTCTSQFPMKLISKFCLCCRDPIFLISHTMMYITFCAYLDKGTIFLKLISLDFTMGKIRSTAVPSWQSFGNEKLFLTKFLLSDARKKQPRSKGPFPGWSLCLYKGIFSKETADLRRRASYAHGNLSNCNWCWYVCRTELGKLTSIKNLHLLYGFCLIWLANCKPSGHTIVFVLISRKAVTLG